MFLFVINHRKFNIVNTNADEILWIILWIKNTRVDFVKRDGSFYLKSKSLFYHLFRLKEARYYKNLENDGEGER